MPKMQTAAFSLLISMSRQAGIHRLMPQLTSTITVVLICNWQLRDTVYLPISVQCTLLQLSAFHYNKCKGGSCFEANPLCSWRIELQRKSLFQRSRAVSTSIIFQYQKGWRSAPILDHQHLNYTLAKSKFKMLFQKLILVEIRPEDCFVTVKLKDAYFHVQIAQSHRTFLRFAFCEQSIPISSASLQYRLHLQVSGLTLRGVQQHLRLFLREFL